MKDKNRGKSMRDLLLKIFKCPKEHQYIRNVVHQDLGYNCRRFFSHDVSLCGQKYLKRMV
ncbi:unnamed protein product [Hymenolepis diminuta]|uniref:Uncharacterized protein n=1 Tax=Hymenolepis diminuta TaxID=6216 RepID=A0A564YWT7_HYMDI|nr:unnamed protein product [Hymenolepis diminuta]